MRRMQIAMALFAVLTAFVIVLVVPRDEAPADQETVETAEGSAARATASQPPETAPPDSEASRALEALRRRIELARSGDFYLVLDPAAATLTQHYRGVTARTWPAIRVERGRRRLLFVSAEPSGSLTGTAWTAARLEPAREMNRTLLEVDSQGTPQGPKPPLIPPTPEEAVPAPGSYLIHFAEGLTVEVVAGEGPAEATPPRSSHALGHRLRDAWDVLWPGSGSHPRVRLVMPPAEAASLYRSLQDGMPLVIV